MLAGARCTASEQSWQTALVSPVLFFFSSSWLKKNLGVPAELGDKCASAAAAFFSISPQLLQSHPGSGGDRPRFPDLPATVSCKYLASSLRVFISVSLPSSLTLASSWPLSPFLYPPPPIFCFSVWPSRGAHNLPVSSGCFSPREEGMSKGSSLSIQDHYGLLFFGGGFCHSCRVWGKSEN